MIQVFYQLHRQKHGNYYDMERALNDMRNLPNVITEFLSLYADANTANNFLSLDEDGNISDTAINSISNQVVSQ
jgi:hypothetical protein